MHPNKKKHSGKSFIFELVLKEENTKYPFSDYMISVEVNGTTYD